MKKLEIELFRLLSTYEFVKHNGDVQLPFRIEVFESLDMPNNYRARAWTSNFYNLYPAFLNTDKTGNDLHHIHSSDQVNIDITCIVADDPEILTGKIFENELSVVNYMRCLISKYYNL
jgi:hypothetical protein